MLRLDNTHQGLLETIANKDHAGFVQKLVSVQGRHVNLAWGGGGGTPI